MAKTLIAFFSRADENYFGGAMRYVKVGNTEIVANIIKDLVPADSFKIEMKNPYSPVYMTCIEEAKKDLRAKARPELVSLPRSIGISNFEGKYIEELQTKWEIVPPFIQVEAHPYFAQDELRKTLDKYDIKLMSWYPLGHGDKSLINEPVFSHLAQKYGKTSAQVILRWHTQMGFVVIPGSKNVDHIRDNMDIMDFSLTAEEMAEIAKLNKGTRYYIRTDEALAGFASWRPAFEQ